MMHSGFGGNTTEMLWARWATVGASNPVRTRATKQLFNVAYADIPVYVGGGGVLPLHATSAYTTKQLHQKDFELVVPPKGGC